MAQDRRLRRARYPTPGFFHASVTVVVFGGRRRKATIASVSLDRDSLNLIERDFVIAAVVEFIVRGDSWLAICCATSSFPLFFR
jgi:hypothetical protein